MGGCWLTGLCLLTVLVCGFIGTPLWLWAGLLLAELIYFGAPVLVIILIAAPLLLLIVTPLRSSLLSSPVMEMLKRLGMLPTISKTEKIAIEAGTVWMDREVFSGKPNFKLMLSQPYASLSPDEQAFLDGPVEELCAAVQDWEVWRQNDLPPEVWQMLKRHKVFGMIIPKRYGGLEFSALANSAVVSKLASRSMPLAITAMVPNSLGPAELLLHYGTEEQKNHYLPRLADGREVPCFALTEPMAGSDAGSLSASGVLFKDKQGQVKLKLNFQKRYITLAAVSTLIGLAFKLRDPEGILGRGEDLGITCALIPSDTPGVQLGRRHDPLGCPFYNCPVDGVDVVIDASQIIGGLEGAGQGWRMLMECLSAGRSISLPALSTGLGKMVTRSIGAYAQVRRQFGMPIGNFEGIEEPLAEIAAMTYLMEAARVYTCGAVDQGQKPSVISAMVKYHFTEIGRRIINNGMDIAGGSGISRGPKNLLAHIYASIPIAITVEGANILTRTMIIFGQGIIRCHPHVQKEVEALETKDLASFDRSFWGHVGFALRNTIRAVLLTLSRGYLAYVPGRGLEARVLRRVAWASAVFAVLSEIALAGYGGSLKRKEKITGRLGDMASWMYLATAVVRRYRARGCPREDEACVRWATAEAMNRIQVALLGILENLHVPIFPRWMGACLSFVFRLNPMGSPPSDKLGSMVAEQMQKPGSARDMLTQGIYIPRETSEALGLLESALISVHQSEKVMRKLKDAVKKGKLEKAETGAMVARAREAGLITEEEAQNLDRSEALCREAVQVNAYHLDDYSKQLRPQPL